MEETKAVILFDGVCNLCNRAIDCVLKADRKKQFRYVSIQSDEGNVLLHQYSVPKNTDSVILLKDGFAFLESEAAIEIGKMLPPPLKWAGLFRVFPLTIRNKIYRWIARNRYRWFGKRVTCRLIKN